MPNLQRRFPVRIKNLRRSLTTRPPPRIHKLLQKHLAQDPIRLFFEDGGEDDGDAVGGREEVDRFGGTVGERHDFGTGVEGAFFDGGRLDFGLEGETALEGGGEGVALQEGDGED